MILDIFSRYLVGWMVAHGERAALAKRLIGDTRHKQDIVPGQLIIHAARGSSMKSKCVAQLLADMGVTKTHSRPHVSNDNPYSESQFKTLNYCPQFPERFGSIQNARDFCQDLFPRYNQDHRHAGIGLVSPEQLHYGIAHEIVEYRQSVLEATFEANPNRFKGKTPRPPKLPVAAWINRPSSDDARV